MNNHEKYQEFHKKSISFAEAVFEIMEEENVNSQESLAIIVNIMLNIAFTLEMSKSSLKFYIENTISSIPGDDWADIIEKRKKNRDSLA